MHSYKFAISGAMARLCFSADRDAEEIAEGVQWIFEHYDRRFPFGLWMPHLRLVHVDTPIPESIGNDILKAVQFAKDWRDRGAAADAVTVAIDESNLQASVIGMAMDSVTAFLEEAGATEWSLVVEEDVSVSPTGQLGGRIDSRQIHAHAHARV